MKGNKRASSGSGERHSNSRHREEQVQTGSGPGMCKNSEEANRPTEWTRERAAGVRWEQ